MKMKEIVWELTPNEYMYGIYFVVSHHTLLACKLMINPNMKSAQSAFKNCVYTMPPKHIQRCNLFFFFAFTTPLGRVYSSVWPFAPAPV